ncbi:MAG: response regulator [Bacteroidales bacterium]|nr:response regulator [Bacteroidales bacterium]
MNKFTTEDLSRYNILIVDDVPLNLILVQKMLSMFNFRVRTAANGLEAMREILSEKPDLILLDLMMPLMDGFEVITRVREREELSDIRIVVLSALGSNEDIVRSYELGANDFISKPIILEKLVNTVATQFQLIECERK